MTEADIYRIIKQKNKEISWHLESNHEISWTIIQPEISQSNEYTIKLVIEDLTLNSEFSHIDPILAIAYVTSRIIEEIDKKNRLKLVS